MTSQNLLFLCTGNYYRSRIAEAIFNHLVTIDQLNWRAFSRGLRPKSQDVDLAPEAREYLAQLRIPLSMTGPVPQKLTTADLAKSSMVVAVYEAEHRPMVAKQFPQWENRVHYWQVPDIDICLAKKAMPQLEVEVRDLFECIKDGCAMGCGSGLEF